jgi:predicted nucleotidyltransferase
MDKIVWAELTLLRDIIINTLPVEQIFLFGSYAYGVPHKDSDLDLYVVLKDETQLRDMDAALILLSAIAEKKTLPVDLLMKKQSDFSWRKTEPTMERRIVREGILLYG